MPPLEISWSHESFAKTVEFTEYKRSRFLLPGRILNDGEVGASDFARANIINVFDLITICCTIRRVPGCGEEVCLSAIAPGANVRTARVHGLLTFELSDAREMRFLLASTATQAVRNAGSTSLTPWTHAFRGHTSFSPNDIVKVSGMFELVVGCERARPRWWTPEDEEAINVESSGDEESSGASSPKAERQGELAADRADDVAPRVRPWARDVEEGAGPPAHPGHGLEPPLLTAPRSPPARQQGTANFCPHCGEEVRANFLFCGSCGRPLENSRSVEGEEEGRAEEFFTGPNHSVTGHSDDDAAGPAARRLGDLGDREAAPSRLEPLANRSAADADASQQQRTAQQAVDADADADALQQQRTADADADAPQQRTDADADASQKQRTAQQALGATLRKRRWATIVIQAAWRKKALEEVGQGSGGGAEDEAGGDAELENAVEEGGSELPQTTAWSQKAAERPLENAAEVERRAEEERDHGLERSKEPSRTTAACLSSSSIQGAASEQRQLEPGHVRPTAAEAGRFVGMEAACGEGAGPELKPLLTAEEDRERPEEMEAVCGEEASSECRQPPATEVGHDAPVWCYECEAAWCFCKAGVQFTEADLDSINSHRPPGDRQFEMSAGRCLVAEFMKYADEGNPVAVLNRLETAEIPERFINFGVQRAARARHRAVVETIVNWLQRRKLSKPPDPTAGAARGQGSCSQASPRLQHRPPASVPHGPLPFDARFPPSFPGSQRRGRFEVREVPEPPDSPDYHPSLAPGRAESDPPTPPPPPPPHDPAIADYGPARPREQARAPPHDPAIRNYGPARPREQARAAGGDRSLEDDGCVVCMRTSSELDSGMPFIFEKCGHKCVCKPCSRKLKEKHKSKTPECPLCRQPSRLVLDKQFSGTVFRSTA